MQQSNSTQKSKTTKSDNDKGASNADGDNAAQEIKLPAQTKIVSLKDGSLAIEFTNKKGNLCLLPVRQFQGEHPIGFDFATDPTHCLFMEKSAKRKDPDYISGRLLEDPKLITRFGMGIEKTTDSEIATLTTRFADQIKLSPGTRENFLMVLQDKKVFEAYSQFLEDKGVLGTNDPGVYHANPLSIRVGGEDPLAQALGPRPPRSEQLTLIHEVMHYLGDKADVKSAETIWHASSDHYLYTQ